MREIALAVVAPVVPDTAEYRYSAFSRAANTYIRNLLQALESSGLPPTLVLSFLALPAFPRGRRVAVRGAHIVLEGGTPVRLMAFPNIPYLKQAWLGIAACVHLCVWACGRARGKSRLIFCFNLTVPPGMFLWAAARLTRSKIVVSLNDIAVPGQGVPDRFPQRLDFWSQRHVIPRCDGHVAVSDAIMRDFAPNREWVRLDGGVTDQQCRPYVRSARSQAGQSVFTVLLAGGLEEVNGIRVVLGAAALESVVPVRWLIAGAGPLENLVVEAAQTNPRLTYLGFLSPLELADAYRDADLLLNVRLTQSVNTRYFFPSKLIEYLATGTPVLTTATGHALEEYGAFVLHLLHESPAELLAAVTRAARLPPAVLLAMGTEGRDYVRRAKHWRSHGVELSKYLTTVARGGPMTSLGSGAL